MHRIPVIKPINIQWNNLNVSKGILTCWITFTKSFSIVRRFCLLIITAVVKYRRIWGHMVSIAFRYLWVVRSKIVNLTLIRDLNKITYWFWYSNISTIKSRPLAWLKKMNRDQWISQVLCCKACSGVLKVLLSIYSFNLFKSSRAVSQFCIKISDASFPHRPFK